MATLIAIGYPEEGTAEYVRAELESEPAIQVDQVAVITRDEDGKYHVHVTHDGAGSIWGDFWGELFGHGSEKGIDEAVEDRVREHLQPGTSALLMVVEHMTGDEAVAALQRYGGAVIQTSPSSAQATS